MLGMTNSTQTTTTRAHEALCAIVGPEGNRPMIAPTLIKRYGHEAVTKACEEIERMVIGRWQDVAMQATEYAEAIERSNALALDERRANPLLADVNHAMNLAARVRHVRYHLNQRTA